MNTFGFVVVFCFMIFDVVVFFPCNDSQNTDSSEEKKEAV